MSYDHIVLILKNEGVAAWNKWMINRFVNPDHILPNVQKKGYMRVQDLYNMENTLNLRGADLREERLVMAEFRNIDLSEANLCGADLRGVVFDNVIMNNTRFDNGIFGDTIIANTNLKFAKGLDSCHHLSPSSIDNHSIFKSWPISIKFLRGFGLSENYIEYLPTIIEDAIQFFTCFLSYSHKDREFSERLYTDLQDKGIRTWYAPADMKIGDEIRPSIDNAIKFHDKLLIILSENSIYSAWVKKEVETAFERENRENKPILFPIRLDNTVLETDQAWAADIRRNRHIGDFRGWKNFDKYKKAFQYLLRDLKN